MSSWDHDSDLERWYHSSKQAWRHTDEWPSWSEARLDTEAHVTMLEKQVADLRTNVTQLTTRLEKNEACSRTHQAVIAQLEDLASRKEDLQFVVDARRRGIQLDEFQTRQISSGSQNAARRLLPVAIQDAPRRQSIPQVDPWQDFAARRQGNPPGGDTVAAAPQICSTLHSSHRASVISRTVLNRWKTFNIDGLAQ